jgi:NTE family protein
MNYKNKKTNLIIGGGGIKGLCFLGALEKLFKIYPFEQFENFSGVSVGSFIIILLIIGYNVNELKDFFIQNDLYTFTDYKFSTLINEYGCDKGDKLVNLIKAFFKTKNIDYNITFIQFYEKFNKIVYICASNITLESVEYFSHINNPNMKIIDAIRISVSVPILFTPILYNNYYYVDGVLLEHYPILPFKNSKKNISILLDFDKNNNIQSFDSYLKKLIYSISNHLSHLKIEKYLNNDIIYILNNNTNTLDFKLNNQNKYKLFQIGSFSFLNIYTLNIYNKILKKYYFYKIKNL